VATLRNISLYDTLVHECSPTARVNGNWAACEPGSGAKTAESQETTCKRCGLPVVFFDTLPIRMLIVSAFGANDLLRSNA
jgi:hypothetical protein